MNIAIRRGQTLAQMALVWLLKDSRVTSVLIGASSVSQLDGNVAALKNMKFTIDELQEIELILSTGKSDQGFSKAKEISESNSGDKTPSRGDFIQSLAKKFERK